ncbi:hypothetical protein PC116_g20830 [Phytophthora cactorum]|uniref:Uncharacterized protein n=1 Tax=Phytophthora cactorum TaxID=29920 RepID=A0A8T1FKB5_9STRA|nr:hypothetical protein PC112_g14628 [Phytophthora cactorum]KAG2815107.1 hypothetical protein PC111_g13701 [Phytophthora cactorum]KAG2850517.1 hypothetical protein PC113_g16706 [Phytophthora cactorum]KAG2888409.1 hypothetical protein PC114_g18422 [Phytophthora cactorum]KAG2906977.1 hypothetical protein PC115_g14089 [Phytophthora cactorum]
MYGIPFSSSCRTLVLPQPSHLTLPLQLRNATPSGINGGIALLTSSNKTCRAPTSAFALSHHLPSVRC